MISPARTKRYEAFCAIRFIFEKVAHIPKPFVWLTLGLFVSKADPAIPYTFDKIINEAKIVKINKMLPTIRTFLPNLLFIILCIFEVYQIK